MGHRVALVLLATAALAFVAGCGESSPSPSSLGDANALATVRIPGGIADDCSTDVTKQLLDWFASVPNDSVLSFSTNGCYRVEGTLVLRARNDLFFDGHGATFRSSNPPSDHRAIWRLVDSRRIVLRDMTIRGSYAHGGTFAPNLQHAHAVDVDGSSVDIENVTMSDVAGDCVYFGRGPGTSLTLSSGTVLDSTCLRTSRNAIAVVAGEDILVQRVRTGSIGYNVFDLEPNVDTGWGSNGVTFDDNTIGSYAKSVYSIVEGAPISNQSFTNNYILGAGLKIAIGDPAHAGYRARDVTISGNTAETPQAPAAINVDRVDGLTITANTIPLTGGPMAAVTGSCGVDISGNRYPSGSTEALIYPSVCSFTPAHGPTGTPVVVNGSGLNQASSAAIGKARARFAPHSSMRMTVFVPRHAVSGAITVTTPNGSATSSARFTVTG